MRLAGTGAFVVCLPPHPRHQPSDTMTAYDNAFPAQIGRNLAAAEERILGENPVDLFHHRQRVRTGTDRRVVEGRTRQLHQLARLADPQFGTVMLDHGPLLCRAHRFSPSNKKSSSTASLPILACSYLTFASVGPLCSRPENTSAIPSIACRFHVLTWFGCN